MGFPNRELELNILKQGYQKVVGVDEARRGCLVGNLVVVGVILPPHFHISGINDSKKISEKKREQLFEQIIKYPELKYAISIIPPSTIDKVNILQAVYIGVNQVITKLKADYAFFDGNRIPKSSPCHVEPIIKGDGKCLNIAVASIIAKVIGDRHIREMDKVYPGWNFVRNKGYCTKDHKEKILRGDITPIHRFTFTPVKSRWRRIEFI
jgi:ribonuclease HII